MTPTREQVIEMAKAAKLPAVEYGLVSDSGWADVDRFASIVWQAARDQALEDAAGACDEPGIYTKHDMQQAIRALKGTQ
jgi:hypothetical protein